MKIREKAKIAVIGGGVAGSSVALILGELGLDITLFEKKETLVDGPPICHLHAGGNLYREISDAQCLQLLKESIEFVKLYPFAVDVRPTVIAVPKSDKGEPSDLFSRLEILKKEYASLVKSDTTNKVLGDPSEYYRVYDKETLKILQKSDIKKEPKSFDAWMIPVAKGIDFEQVKFPLIMVQEYGLNIFKLASSVTLALSHISNVNLLTQTNVCNVTQKGNSWLLEYEKRGKMKEDSFDYLINAAGFRSGNIDDMLGFKRERFVEFKAAYVTKWKSEALWPEVIFYGERGTPQGMAQFTPYPDGYFQLHGMTESITLFKDGLVKSSSLSAQPKLDSKFLTKIERGWSKTKVASRTLQAIKHLAQYIPEFSDAKVASKPLYGAQQIPGDDATLRAAEVSFEGKRYARCEIVKASSVLAMADAISKQLIDLGYLQSSFYAQRDFKSMTFLDDAKVSALSEALATTREYPKSLADVNNKIVK